jgi:predicted AAA+ superfamily ATPase
MNKKFAEEEIRKRAARGESIVVLGNSMTGKSEFIRKLFPDALCYDFDNVEDRRCITENPSKLVHEILNKLPSGGMITILEFQKIPAVCDDLQAILHLHSQENRKYQFVLSSSCLRLNRKEAVYTLPNRFQKIIVGTIESEELGVYDSTEVLAQDKILEILTYGQLPKILALPREQRAAELSAEVTTYLSQQIQARGMTKDLVQFERILNLLAIRSGQILNYSEISQAAGVSVNTIKHHVAVLKDTYLIHLIPGLSFDDTKNWLTTPKLLFFDLGVRNLLAERVLESKALIAEHEILFKQWIGLEIVAWSRRQNAPLQIYYWRTAQRRSVDWVLRDGNRILLIEAKWSEFLGRGELSAMEALRQSLLDKNFAVDSLLVNLSTLNHQEGRHKTIPVNHFFDALETWAKAGQ